MRDVDAEDEEAVTTIGSGGGARRNVASPTLTPDDVAGRSAGGSVVDMREWCFDAGELARRGPGSFPGGIAPSRC